MVKYQNVKNVKKIMLRRRNMFVKEDVVSVEPTKKTGEKNILN